ncbi:hypothetical protein GE21DRAFT_10539 [Neurospora crassa]|uniref:Uncharacterized protein n=1 Tax=Neurospora crassa (strain ATCC 24698 / 74-OR23-1A / CBS 708.71 / DSM 1257 / FGSC 987) TaxID=367110 RepID=Q7S4K6_NEUCR|nr:hypothetical protein NCU08125 [Neurospora crassa OR74A]EAA30432.3 hypothetical protein NCU08125 [Neurospora crassa OR74A]KHE79494.1 hypothetical protein GE21DRAFT_10539 [Neurospora crassa]|eukprot:XP_959668.3 hypothetical protein NCU08125 [Neurospora crassa OR74A]
MDCDRCNLLHVRRCTFLVSLRKHLADMERRFFSFPPSQFACTKQLDYIDGGFPWTSLRTDMAGGYLPERHHSLHRGRSPSLLSQSRFWKEYVGSCEGDSFSFRSSSSNTRKASTERAVTGDPRFDNPQVMELGLLTPRQAVELLLTELDRKPTKGCSKVVETGRTMG